MKIYYEPYPGFNNSSSDGLIFGEPEEFKLLREIGVEYIFYKISQKGLAYNFWPIMDQLSPEQRQVLLSHAYIICNNNSAGIFKFRELFRDELQRLADCEIEPGMFKR
ncbi:MAG: hypothetical protein ACXACY_19070 [Candidatus Hodarchaeales archaeon]|jgi:hypothetical protein